MPAVFLNICHADNLVHCLVGTLPEHTTRGIPQLKRPNFNRAWIQGSRFAGIVWGQS